MSVLHRKLDLIEFIYDALEGTEAQVTKTVNSVMTRYQVDPACIGTDERNGLYFLVVDGEHSTAQIRLSKSAKIMHVEYKAKTGVKEIKQAARAIEEVKEFKIQDDREVLDVVVDEFTGALLTKSGKPSPSNALAMLYMICDDNNCDLNALDWTYDNGLVLIATNTGRSYSIAC